MSFSVFLSHSSLPLSLSLSISTTVLLVYSDSIPYFALKRNFWSDFSLRPKAFRLRQHRVAEDRRTDDATPATDVVVDDVLSHFDRRSPTVKTHSQGGNVFPHLRETKDCSFVMV